MGSSPTEQASVDNLVNCQEGSFPFTDLGFPVSNHIINMVDCEPLVGEVAAQKLNRGKVG